MLEVRRVESGESRFELLYVGQQRLSNLSDLRRADRDTVERQNRVDDIVRFVDDDDVAGEKAVQASAGARRSEENWSGH